MEDSDTHGKREDSDQEEIAGLPILQFEKPSLRGPFMKNISQRSI